MFKEIRTSEKINDRRKQNSYLYGALFDCRLGSEKRNLIQEEIDRKNHIVNTTMFDPDARI